MGNCFGKSNKFQIKQMKDEYYKKKVNMNIIGNYKPHQVFCGEEIKDIKIINGLNSMCECDIHLSIGNKPIRLILSYVDVDMGNYKKGNSFHIYNIDYKEITTIDEITQYDIYNAIQDYIYINKQFPKNDNMFVAI